MLGTHYALPRLYPGSVDSVADPRITDSQQLAYGMLRASDLALRIAYSIHKTECSPASGHLDIALRIEFSIHKTHLLTILFSYANVGARKQYIPTAYRLPPTIPLHLKENTKKKRTCVRICYPIQKIQEAIDQNRNAMERSSWAQERDDHIFEEWRETIRKTGPWSVATNQEVSFRCEVGRKAMIFDDEGSKEHLGEWFEPLMRAHCVRNGLLMHAPGSDADLLDE
eukprot:320824-Prymnesium_polylepis.1